MKADLMNHRIGLSEAQARANIDRFKHLEAFFDDDRLHCEPDRMMKVFIASRAFVAGLEQARSEK